VMSDLQRHVELSTVEGRDKAVFLWRFILFGLKTTFEIFIVVGV
jgi:hypothetical protein